MGRAALLLLFSLCISLSIQSDYDPNLAFEMLRASSASYCNATQLENMDCGDVCNDLKGYSFITQFQSKIHLDDIVSYSLLVNPTSKTFVCSFRGTRSPVQLIDEIINGGYVTYDLYNITNAQATRFFYEHYIGNLRDSFLSNLTEQIQKYPDFQYYFVGHSLGGAFATQAILDVVLGGVLKKDQVHMYNYGSPRVGNIDLAHAVDAAIEGEIFRVVHYKDLVPHVPPCILDIKGNCKASTKEEEDNTILYYCWHVTPEIFYDTEDSSEYKICPDDEDTTCSDKFLAIELSIEDHLHYLGVSTHCNRTSAFSGNEWTVEAKELVLDALISAVEGQPRALEKISI